MYPDLPLYKALAKWLNSDAGKRVNAAKNRDVYERNQRATALSSNYTGSEPQGVDGVLAQNQQMANRSVGHGTGLNWSRPGVNGDPASVQSAANTTWKHASLVTKDNIDTLVKKFGLSFDAAATMLVRGGN